MRSQSIRLTGHPPVPGWSTGYILDHRDDHDHQDNDHQDHDHWDHDHNYHDHQDHDDNDDEITCHNLQYRVARVDRRSKEDRRPIWPALSPPPVIVVMIIIMIMIGMMIMVMIMMNILETTHFDEKKVVASIFPVLPWNLFSLSSKDHKITR